MQQKINVFGNSAINKLINTNSLGQGSTRLLVLFHIIQILKNF